MFMGAKMKETDQKSKINFKQPIIKSQLTIKISDESLDACQMDELLNLRKQVTRLEAERAGMDKKMVKSRIEALYDPLTQLPNRRLLIDRFHHAIQTSKRNNTYLALLFFDIDKFKTTNDTYGHLIGDKFLIEVARRMQKSIRQTDTLARLGGDEFVALLTSLDSDKDLASSQVTLVAEKILMDVARPIKIKSQAVTHKIDSLCRVSVGINLFLPFNQGQKNRLENIMALADQAMFNAKIVGGNRIQIN
jgi:diguanylate cyclase (GGDEF)-like protein